MPCRTKKSSTCLHLLMHIFMVHGVDPLVEEAVNRYHVDFPITRHIKLLPIIYFNSEFILVINSKIMHTTYN
jgi:hypothetical protein